MVMSDQLYFRQLLAGRDFARDDAIAGQMANFVYAFGDRQSGEAVVVDPAYRPREILDALSSDAMRVVGVVATHYHADHVGGRLGSHVIAGLQELLEITDVPIHVQDDEASWITSGTTIGDHHLVRHQGGDELRVGAITATLLHTPGHSAGSQCVLVDRRLVSGDTLFLDGCGRTDLPGSNPELMYRTLRETLSKLDDSTWLYPGHDYSDRPTAQLDDVRRHNAVLAPLDLAQWLATFTR